MWHERQAQAIQTASKQRQRQWHMQQPRPLQGTACAPELDTSVSKPPGCSSRKGVTSYTCAAPATGAHECSSGQVWHQTKQDRPQTAR